MPNPVVHFEIGGKDGDQLQKFYGSLFDWQINHDPQMNYGLVQPGGEGGIGGGIFTSPHGQPIVTFYVMVDDLQAYLDKAVRLGGKEIMGPQPIPGHGSCAMFTDPEGNCIGLFKTG